MFLGLPGASRPPTWLTTWTWGLGRIASKVPPLAPGRRRSWDRRTWSVFAS